MGTKPWSHTGRCRWKTVHGPITDGFLLQVEGLITAGHQTALGLAGVLSGMGPGDRRIDKALQLLKAAGRIKYDHHGRRWTVVEGGGK